jgi:hypothetical protein
VKYWREKYVHVEELLKQWKRQAQTHKDKLSDLAERTNDAMKSIVHLAQTQLRINDSDLTDVQRNNHNVHAIAQQSESDLSREARRPTRVSSATSSSTYHPASSRENSDLSASSSSTSILSTNSEGSTQQHEDHGGFPNSSNLSGTASAHYIKPFQNNMSDRSDHDSDGAQAVDPIPATANDDNDNDDDKDSTHTITKSASQHSLLRSSHRDSPESHMHAEEPEDLREFREVHQRITKKYGNPK